MTSTLDVAPASVMDVLRGERTRRPLANNTAAAGLRAALEDGLYELLGASLRTSPLNVRASSFRSGDYTTTSPLAQIRGILIVQALRLLSVGADLDDLYHVSLLAWRAEVGSNELLGRLDQLDADDLARLVTDVTAHGVTLKRSLGELSSRWYPRTSLRAYQRLGGGNVVLRDVVDLMVGTTTSDVASVALLDVTTSTLGADTDKVLRYHALVQTLRTSVAPLRSALFSTATGDLVSLDVDEELLFRSVDDVLDVLRAMMVGP